MTETYSKLSEHQSDNPVTPREMALEFHGSAREYFRIWIVNLCLTLLSFGVYSAWAKVRKKRYFYSHTTLDGTPFQYLAQPVPILKGRIVAAVLFSIYYAASHYFTSVMPYVLVAGLVLAPWVIVRSAAFNARYSAFRNMNFCFDGHYRDALITIYAWGLIPVLVIGTMFHWGGNLFAAAGLYAIFGLAFPWWLKRFKNLIISHTAFGGKNGEFSASGGQFFKIYFMAGLIMTMAGFVAGLIGTSLISPLHKSPYAFLLVSFPVYAGYVLAFAYIQARTSNLVWNRTRLGPLYFESTLRSRGLVSLYVTNALGIVASAGLLTPWAVIRTLKYRVDHMRVHNEGDLADFSGSPATAVRATGAEVGEFFSMDLSL